VICSTELHLINPHISYLCNIMNLGNQVPPAESMSKTSKCHCLLPKLNNEHAYKIIWHCSVLMILANSNLCKGREWIAGHLNIHFSPRCLTTLPSQYQKHCEFWNTSHFQGTGYSIFNSTSTIVPCFAFQLPYLFKYKLSSIYPMFCKKKGSFYNLKEEGLKMHCLLFESMGLFLRKLSYCSWIFNLGSAFCLLRTSFTPLVWSLNWATLVVPTWKLGK
jgi:hypothetical protein